ncbi:hypothetical protein EYB25_006172 [Talaromyces marneffei]|uniref:uncharacterized protein n=1 Tax=Talaromyces marneffei TaxID=37727 RepID=UPI0012A8335D|nr:uncharacterized protein EYB26_006537 [Talaromyces marneffei]KAE8552278.1 hypothetical protein EYB25_006172 [Talaromyces marneffei]QGA18852.1 hypothetical protein EYB26_006537 [Talaromyces marneffei]
MNQIFKSIPILCLFSLVSAQYGNPGGSGANTVTTSSLLPSSTTATSSAVQTVTVGRGGLIFSPDTLTVSPGGKVEFQFVSGDHSVTQSTFADPCHPVNETSLSSGIISAGGGPPVVFTVTINDTKPLWYYCAQGRHCQAGMVGVINPPPTGPNTLDAYKAAAKNANASTDTASVNGGVFGVEASSSPSASSTAASSTSASATAASGTASSSPIPTGDAPVFGAWSKMSTLLLLSVLAALCFM